MDGREQHHLYKTNYLWLHTVWELCCLGVQAMISLRCSKRGKKKKKNNKNWCVLLVRKHKSIFSSCTMLKRVRHGHTVQINFSFQCSVWQASSSEQWNPALFALPWISVSLGCCCYRILKRPFVIRNKWFKSTKKCRVLAAWLGTTYW